ncbi:hypothetical protein [Paenibacillus contaminans]|uniref:Uncharacterized protein n=1 Tax=Paenibacillus contaminans TaxID=450362 RepID=A0A329MQP1_9BACL|nr:hypothetical protein [Paenibacillus contaminans]RAV21872.1 hypothetical protein DQG23_07410 [Paenibacillus contaminans]
MKRLLPAAVLLVIIGSAFLIQDFRRSYPDIPEAIDRYKKTDGFQMKTLIGGHTFGEEAVYFYVNRKDEIVGVELGKGVFGWMVRGLSTGSGMSLKEVGERHSFTGGINTNNRIIFGLATLDESDRIIINGEDAALIPLGAHLEEEEAKGKYAWAIVFDKRQQSYKKEIIDKDNRKIVESP